LIQQRALKIETSSCEESKVKLTAEIIKKLRQILAKKAE
jgi:hypothetical protein